MHCSCLQSPIVSRYALLLHRLYVQTAEGTQNAPKAPAPCPQPSLMDGRPMTPDAFSASLERSAAKHPALKGPPHRGAVASDRGGHGSGEPARPHRHGAPGRGHRGHAAPALERHRPSAQATGRRARLSRGETGARRGHPGKRGNRVAGAQDRQRSHARACTFSCTCRQSGIEIRCARPSPPGRGHAQHARHGKHSPSWRRNTPTKESP